MRLLIMVLIMLVSATPISASLLAPIAANPGFEDDHDGWSWVIANGAQASFRIETGNPRSGKKCVVFSNRSGMSPHVYGRFSQMVHVLPETEYELSVWVRGTEVEGDEGNNHFTDWNSYMLNLPAGNYDWQKRSVTFKTKPGQHYLNIGLNIANRIKELAIDDVSLRPVGIPLKGNGVEGRHILPARIVGHNAPGYIQILVNPTYNLDTTLEATVTSGSRVIFARKAVLRPGENEFMWEWNSGSVPFGRLDCTIFVLDRSGKVLASAESVIQKADSPISTDLDKAEARFREFEALYAKCKAAGIWLDYPTVARTTFQQFLPYAREDVQKGHDWRARFAAQDFARMLDAGIAEMQAYLDDFSLAPNVRRYRTGKVAIDGLSFVGERLDSGGERSKGPVFFCGYGHFTQVRKDMPKWPNYGINIIQIEIGPSLTLPAENEVSLKGVNDIAKVLDDAAKHNVRVDVLLSPHYFPQWAMSKWPHLGKGGGGFLGFCVDAPEAKSVVEKHIRTVVTALKDKPALHSFCLTNEPIFDRTAGADNTKAMWEDRLAQTHGDVVTMNARYGTEYKSFAEVPIPGNDHYAAPQFYDYVVFNQERFAAWHKWMADIIRDIAPHVPVHAKIMNSAVLQRYTIAWSVDPELFGALSDINGNDCYWFPHGKTVGWHTQNIGYGIQRSLSFKPIFNSENHISPDRSNYYIAPENFRSALWQGAVHGQSATTIWVWERTFDTNYDFYGNVMDRPGCAQAVGVTCLDLNRFSEEIAALQHVKSPVAVVWSNASVARSPAHMDTMFRAYTALNFCGVKVDFISEKQLAAGKASEYRIIVLPEVTHLPQASLDALGEIGPSTHLVIVGEAPSKDPYGREVPVGYPVTFHFSRNADPQKEMWPELMGLLSKLGTLPDVRVVDAATGEPVWGVEWLTAKVGNRTIINMINLLETPVDVKIVGVGSDKPPAETASSENLPQAIPFNRTLNARNLLSLGGRENVGTLNTLTPVLAEVGEQ